MSLTMAALQLRPSLSMSIRTKILLLISIISLCASFSPVTQPQRQTGSSSSSLSSSSTTSESDETALSSSTTTSAAAATTTSSNCNARRKVLSTITGSFVMAVPAIAEAGLLDDYGSNPSKIEAKKEAPVETAPKGPGSPRNTAIDPTLKGSYYYPTAKKRYAPRIQKVTEQIVQMPDAIANQDWTALADFGKVADNAILPLQLYVSSLDGQGLGMANSYAKQMKQDAAAYEKAYKEFVKALGKQNSAALLTAVTDMAVAVASYRQTGGLRDDDGNIPSVDEMRRMAMRKPTVALPTTYK